MIALYVCPCGRSLAIASDKMSEPAAQIACDACGRIVVLTLKRLLQTDAEFRFSASSDR